MFGDPMANPSLRTAGTPFGSISIGEEFLTIDSPIPVPRFGTGIIGVTAVALRLITRRARGLAFVDPQRTEDLLGYWNLRATGADVVPWPLGSDPAAMTHLLQWLVSPHATTEGEPIEVWIPSEDARDTCLGLLSSVPGVPAATSIHYLSPIPDSYEPGRIESLYSRSFTVNFESTDSEFAVPLPDMELLLPSAWYEHRGLMMAEVEIQGVDHLPPGRSTAIPVPRRLSPRVLDSTSALASAFARPNTDGVLVAVDARKSDVDVPLVPSSLIFESVFDSLGLKVAYSDAGRYVTRIIEMLGGVGSDSAALQPAVRAVLRKASASPYGHPAKALVQEAKDNQGEWPQDLRFWNTDYSAWVVKMLCARGLLRSVLKSTCPACGNVLVVDPRDISDDLKCHLCGEQFPLALHVASRRPSWLLAMPSTIEPRRVAETHPVMAALSIISRLSYRGSGQHFLSGIKVNGPGVDCEVDVAVAMRDDGQPIYILGECKNYKDQFSESDIRNLVDLQSRFFDAGLECYVLFSTMREALRTEELALLREAFAEVRTTAELRRPGRIDAILPLILTEGSLSTASMSPMSIAKGHFRVSDLARATCEQSLGLASMNFGGARCLLLWRSESDGAFHESPTAEINSTLPTESPVVES
jgi:hypothetical protein